MHTVRIRREDKGYREEGGQEPSGFRNTLRGCALVPNLGMFLLFRDTAALVLFLFFSRCKCLSVRAL
jgi:hypothetical protein